MSDAENFKGLQRFDVQFGGEDAWVGRQENGDYVLYDDAIARITALEAQLAAANAEVADMQTALDANWVSHQSLVSAGLQLAAADRLVQSSVRLVDVAVRISEVDNDNRMMDDVADTQADIAKFRAIRGGGNG